MMRLIILKNVIFFLFLCFGILIHGTSTYADDAIKKMDVFSNSGLPMPRFVSLENNSTNIRSGPGQKYPIKWVIKRKSLPVEVILEFDHWRKIKDHEGQEGWVFHTLLSGKRTGIITGQKVISAYEKPFSSDEEKARVSIHLEPFVIVGIKECHDVWCAITTPSFSGWIKRKSIWGVYETENID